VWNKVTTSIPVGSSNSTCFRVESIHKTIFNAFEIENHEFSNKIDNFLFLYEYAMNF
jgi:hypothetical protein